MARIVTETVSIKYSVIVPDEGGDPMIISGDDLDALELMIKELPSENGRVVELELDIGKAAED